MANKIIIKISNHPETNMPRAIVFEGIQYLSYSMESAELIWFEYPAKLNEEGKWEPVIKDTIVARRIVTPISNNNKVNQFGITLDQNYIISTNPINEDESQEDYQTRINSILEEELLNSIPEFDFWISTIGWDTIIEQGGVMLEQLKRFDRV